MNDAVVQGSIVLAGAGLVLAVGWFLVKAVISHLIAQRAVNVARRKWGRQQRKAAKEPGE